MSGRNILGSQRAHDVLTCRLCSQYLREPRQLPCGHTFCLACLERYYAAECQRSADTARRRSPSVDRRRHRGLLPCPAAPICLHVAVVPDDGVAGFPVNQRIADMKEHVVNEMAYNISQRIGRRMPQDERATESDTASVRSDETDLSDVSYQTTWSAPAGTTHNQPDARSSYPNLSKFAKYFETEKDGSGSATKFTSSVRSERRRVAITSSFQHRRRRVNVPTPAAFDDSASDIGSKHASRCGSAPQLDLEGVTYRPTVRPRQGSSIASPLLRRARPTSCIIEEHADDRDLLNHIGEKTSMAETPRRATSTDRHRQPLLHERVHLPTHLENISMDEIRRSKPTQDGPAGHGRYHSDDVKMGSGLNKTTHNQDEPLRPNKNTSEKLETGGKSSGTVPARDEPFRPSKYMYQSEKVETVNNDADTKSMPSQDESTRQHKQHSDYLETGATSSRRNADGISSNVIGANIESARNSKSHSDDLKTGKTSTLASSRPSRRVLPNIPTDSNAAETAYVSASRRDRVRQETSSTSNVHHARQAAPRNDKFKVTEHQNASSLGHRQKDPGITKSFSTHTSDPNKPDVNVSGHDKSNFTDTEPQKTRNSRLASHTASGSRVTNSTGVRSFSDSVRGMKPSASTKSHDVDHILKSSGSSTKSSTRDFSMPQKSQDSSKPSASPNVSRYRSAAAGGKGRGTEQVKSSHVGQTESDIHVSVGSKSAHKEQHSQARNKEKQSKGSTVSEKSPPSAAKSRSSKSTPGSGSRLTYKVNAATVGPVLMNSRKSKRSSSDAEQRAPTKIAAGSDTDESHDYKETVSSKNVEIQEQNNDNKSASSHYSNNVSEARASTGSTSSDISSQNKLNEDRCHQQSGVVGDGGDKPGKRQDSRMSFQSDVSSQINDRHSASPKCHTDSHSPQQRQAASDGKTAADSVASDEKEDVKNSKKQQQWQDFMAALQATRAKYSSPENCSPSSESSHPLPVYSDSITPRWRIQRDDFAVPTSVAITSDGSSVIADIANCLLDFTDVDGNVVHSVTGTKPFSVTVGANDVIYVGDRRSRTVRVFDIYGSDVAQWDAETTGFGWISGIATLRNGQLAIIDRERCKVGIYTAGGERVTEFCSYGTKDAQLCMADFVAVDSHDRVIIADSGNHRLKLFDPSAGKLVANFAGRGNTDGCLLWPKGVTVDSIDRIIVADSGNNRICQFADDGRFISNLVSASAKPFHVNFGGDNLLGVSHFALNGVSQVDVFTISSN